MLRLVWLSSTTSTRTPCSALASKGAGGSLRAEVPEGDYDLAIKIVGRGVVRAAISVPAAGLALQCDPDPKSNLRCTGGKRAITLKP